MIDKTNDYRINRDIKLNRAKEYYENNKKRLRGQARNKSSSWTFDKIFLIFFPKMEQKVLIFGTEYIIKDKFHIYAKSINIDKVYIKRIVVSNIEPFGNIGSYKYFIGYIYIYIYMKVMPFHHH